MDKLIFSYAVFWFVSLWNGFRWCGLVDSSKSSEPSYGVELATNTLPKKLLGWTRTCFMGVAAL
jgi:hypothetical protein